MRINPNYQIPSHNKYNTNYHSKISNQNVNFKSFTGFLAGLVARQGIGAVKSTQKVKYLKELEEGISRYYDETNFTEILRALSKTPDSYYDYHHQGWTLWVGSWSGKDPEYVNTLRCNALRHFSTVADNSRDKIQTKKEFLQSFFDNGHEISDKFFNTFKNLNDGIYSAFKVGIIDTCLYSKSYNKIREMKDIDSYCFPRECNPTCSGQPLRDYDKRGNVDAQADRDENRRIALYNNLKLISVLDKNLYRNFIEQRRNTIEQSKEILQRHFDREFTYYKGGPKELYADFLTNIKTI